MTEITIDQPGMDPVMITPLQRDGKDIDEFYNYHGASAHTGLEEKNTSQLFFFEDPESAGGELSLVVIHDHPQKGGGGSAKFAFTPGLPSTGNWTVQDDDWDGLGQHIANWNWFSSYTDGGAYRGGFEDGVEFEIDASFEGIHTWQVLTALDGSEADVATTLEPSDPVTVSVGQDNDIQDSVSASVTTLQFIPGKQENPSEGGHPLNSGLMQIIPGEGVDVTIPFTSRSVSIGPVFDNWLGGDMREDLPDDLEEARHKKFNKYVDDAQGQSFNEYRFENGVSVSFETTDEGGVDEETVEITFSEAGPSGDDPRIHRGEQEPSMTVLHDHDINSLPWEEWYDEQNVRSSKRQPRYYDYDTEFEYDGVEGVRVFTVWGGWAGFMGDFSNRIADNPAEFFSSVWNWPIPTSLAKLVLLAAPPGVEFITESLGVVPNTFSVLDFIVLADGRRYVRVWDASQYPSLATYVDGTRQSLEQMFYEPHQEFNLGMTAFFLRAMSGFTPYEALSLRQFKGFLRQNPILEGELEDELIRLIDKFDLPYTVNELMPTIPRETMGFPGDATESDPLENADEPFSEGILIAPWSGLPYNNQGEE